jgi:hypothetical protein
MKKIILFLISTFIFNFCFPQNYIGKCSTEIIVQETWLLSKDSTESWEKKNLKIDVTRLRKEGKMTIHDPDNFKVITCYFQKDTCNSFMIVYYNLNRPYVEKMLKKKYNYNGQDSWICCSENKHIELCFMENPGEIFVVEVCHYLSSNQIIKEGKSKL